MLYIVLYSTSEVKLVLPLRVVSGYKESVIVDEIKQNTAPVFQRYGVSCAALFGSAARGEDKPGSDVDILVRLGRPTGMVAYIQLIENLEESLHKPVDLVTEKSLNPRLQPYVERDLTVIYER